jgi:hypothetical protein
MLNELIPQIKGREYQEQQLSQKMCDYFVEAYGKMMISRDQIDSFTRKMDKHVVKCFGEYSGDTAEMNKRNTKRISREFQITLLRSFLRYFVHHSHGNETLQEFLIQRTEEISLKYIM